MKSIIFKNVSYSYGTEGFAIKDLSLEIEEGSYIALIGHNGSGKSTLAKLIIGLLPLKKGEITINGLKLEKANYAKIRSQVGIVFQNPDNQFIGSTVEDDIAFGLENRQVPHEDMRGIIDEYSSKVGMKDYLKKEPTNLSGGQKQRVAIARAIVNNPRVLLADEPTGALDQKSGAAIMELFQKLNDEGTTIIMITHDSGIASHAKKTYRIVDGCLYHGLEEDSNEENN